MPSSTREHLFVYTSPTFLQRFIQNPLLLIAKWLYTHQPPVSPFSSRNAIRIACISDTHNAQSTIPHGDILIHAGDLSINGTFLELQRQITWLASLPHEHKIVIAGNHDLVLDTLCYTKHANLLKEIRDRGKGIKDLDWGGVTYLENESITVVVRGRTLRIYGSPLTPQYGNWAFQYLSSSSQSVWRNTVPETTDVLITHGPAKGHLDRDTSGCAGLLEEIWRVVPRLHVHGHIHAGRGLEVLDWGWVQWCYDNLSTGKGGILLRLGYVMLTVVAWIAIWARYLVLGNRRDGKTTVVNAAWEGNEERGVTVVEI